MRHEDFSPIMPMASAITAYMDDHPRQTTVSLGRPTVAATIENVPTGWSSLHVKKTVEEGGWPGREARGTLLIASINDKDRLSFVISRLTRLIQLRRQIGEKSTEFEKTQTVNEN